MKKDSDFKLPNELIEQFALGNGVLWLGAGGSVDSGLPTWEALIRSMSQQLIDETDVREYDLKYSLNMLEVAQLYKNLVGNNYYYNFIRDQIVNRNTSSISSTENLTLEAIANMANHFWPKPGLVVVSTNYDSLLEEILLVKHGKKPRSIVTEHDIATMDTKKDLIVLKPNGDINYPESIILTLADYCEYRSKKPAFITTLAELFTKKTFLFVGYGLGDFTINSILGELQSTLGGFKRRAFLLTKDASNIKKKVYRSIGIDVIGLSSFDDIPFILRAICQKQTTVELVIRKIDELPNSVKEMLSKSKLLLIDDDRHIVDIIRWIFDHYSWGGFKVMSDPQKAINIIKRQNFDFIVTDLAMGKLSGLDIVATARKSKRNKRSIVVIWSGYPEQDRCYRAGADFYFEKPIMIEKIFQKLYILKRLKEGSYD